jgi:uncharacterized protein YutE (UPF0331/DUF86 family)
MDRKKDKVFEIEKFISELESVLPTNIEEYKHDFKIRAICERYFEKIIESTADLACLEINLNGLRKPKNDKDAFEILRDEKIISEELCEKLKDAKGMRNIIAHDYGEIDDEFVFEQVTEHLSKTITKFLIDLK